MKIFRHLDDIPADFGRSVVAIGNYDGIHIAHRRVIREINARAREDGAKSMVITFDPHPVRVLQAERQLKLITPTPVKLKLLAETEVDSVLVLPFTRELSLMSAHDFVHEVLVHRLHVVGVHEGYNFRFGHKAEGDVKMLTDLGHEFGFEVTIYPEIRVRHQSVSSSDIRKVLARGDVSTARRMLGRVFSVYSHPATGRGYGHKYTVPTINLAPYDELLPAKGVYITTLKIGDECFESITNIGVRPTFGSESFAVETHIINFHAITLDETTPLELSFLRRVRDEIKFPSVEALREQIGRDVQKAQRYFRALSAYQK